MRKFDTGATRDNDESKVDYEGFLDPFVLERYCQYMHEHRVQADGTLRDSDNWQKGIPIPAYKKSFIRHTMEVWRAFRSGEPLGDAVETLLCAIVFNAFGILHELLKKKRLGTFGAKPSMVTITRISNPESNYSAPHLTEAEKVFIEDHEYQGKD